MAQRSRKRGHRKHPRAAVTEPTAAPAAAGRTPSAPAAAGPARSRSEARNAAVRATLTPFEPGERPWPIRISVACALTLGAVNLGFFLAGVKPNLGGRQPHLLEILIFSGLMLMCSIGMWRMRYWAVLGFQTLLAVGLLGFSLALIRASTLLGAGVALAVVGGGGVLFYKLVRVLSRIGLPRYPSR